MTTTSRRRQSRRAGAHTMPPVPVPKSAGDRAATIVTAVVFLTIGAFVMIPVVWLLVHGYRWALR